MSEPITLVNVKSGARKEFHAPRYAVGLIESGEWVPLNRASEIVVEEQVRQTLTANTPSGGYAAFTPTMPTPAEIAAAQVLKDHEDRVRAASKQYNIGSWHLKKISNLEKELAALGVVVT